MSLFGKKDLNFDDYASKKGEPKGGNRKRGPTKSISHRKKPAKPKRFQIAETELKMDHPFLSAASSFLSDSDSFLFPESSSSLEPTNATSSRNKIVEAALGSSKLDTIVAPGPIEPSPRIGKRKLKAAKKHAKSLTKGAAWFHMAKTEVTKEKKNDLDVLKLRSAMEGSFHYKRNNMTHTPKYFQVGTIVETKADFYSARIPKKQRKKTLAEEFAAEYGML